MRRVFEHLSRWGWNLYEVAVILGGAVAAVYLSARFSEQVNQEEDVLLFLGILLLYILFDLFRLPYREQTISLGFPVLLFALLGSQRNGPLIAAEIAVLGSLCSDSLYRLFVRHKLLARFDRVLLYTSHHTLAALAAITAFESARMRQMPSQALDTEAFGLFLDPNYILALAAYILVYPLVSSMLIAPHDLAIRSLRLPEDEERLPRVHPIGSVLLMAPVPIAFFVFLFALGGTSRLVFSLVFPALFLAFLIIARSYARIERETISHRSREGVRRRLLGLARFDEELLVSVSDVVDQLLRTPGRCWIAIYSAPAGSYTLRLRGERNPEGRPHIYSTGVVVRQGTGSQPATADTRGDLGGIRWPRQIKPGQGPLGRAVKTRLVQSNLTARLASQGSETDPLLPPGTAYLYVPLQHLAGVIGLLALARPRRRFTKQDVERLMPLADVLGESLIQIQCLERQIKELYGQVEDYVADPMAVTRALKSLVARGVTRMPDILALTLEHAFQKQFDEVLEAFAKGRGTNRLLALDDKDLTAIYNEVRARDVDVMPPLDHSILHELHMVASSLSVPFRVQRLLSERDRSEALIPLYRVCQTALEAETISDIIGQRSGIQEALEELEATTEGVSLGVTLALGRLDVAIADLEQSKTEHIDQRRLRLRDALSELNSVEQMVKRLEELPVRLILLNWVTGWRKVISAVLAVESGEEAELVLALRSKRALPLKRVDVVLQVQNGGRGLATRVVIELLPQVGYEVAGDPQFNLGDLQPHKTKEAEFAIEPQVMDSFRLTFQVSYRDCQDTRPKTQNFADRFSLEGGLPTHRPVDNPYVFGRPLPGGSPLFFGRNDVFEFIRQNLGGGREPQVLVLVGERRVGKTSIALQLPCRLQDEGYIHAYFDAQSAVDPGQFLLTLATTMAESLEDAGIAMDHPTPEQFQAGPGYAFEHRFLPQVWERLGERRLLIAIDEYETLQRRVESGKEDPDVFEYLRSLIQHRKRMAFIFFGTQQMQELTAGYWHVLFNIAKHRSIGLLSQAEARRLIVEPVQGEIVHDELAINEILRGTGCHPSFLQMVCDTLIESCNDDQVSYVTLSRVRKALRKVVETGKPHLEWLWNSTSPDERVVLAGLADCVWEGKLGTAAAIARQAQQVGQALDLGAVHRALGRLAGRDILAKPLKGADFYEFTASLYHTWIRLAHPLAQQMTTTSPM